LYTGQSQSLGIKQGDPAAGQWAELPFYKVTKINQLVVGHESHHALLVTEDGSTFFVGTPKRGEDGDGSLRELFTQGDQIDCHA
jgi:E3 ubiquitin-protein ligase MYCBP2